MEDFIMQNEKTIRLGFFLGVFTVMALFEVIAPRRALSHSKIVRWGNNLGLTIFNTFVLRVLFPTAAVGMALFAQEQGWGVFNYYPIASPVAIIASVIVMDFFIYIQHVMVHAIPLLWRLHRVHHADLDYDVTTGARFHTLEIILSMGIKFAVILLLGPPIVAVVMFEIILNATAMFNHSNVRIPEAIDKILRSFIVTPDMHRVHHSIADDEANSNFGFSLPWWDRLFGTYRAQPRGGHAGMTIGIRSYRDSKHCSWLSGILIMPFIGKISDYAINRRQWGDNEQE
ncbi:MAG: sterol desaturase family protein [Gammaproteobacteria bacterium]|nr:sterol desaturase family protein [Gammaproteobacteria bacterium]